MKNPINCDPSGQSSPARTGEHRDKVRERLLTFSLWSADADIDIITLASTVETCSAAIKASIHRPAPVTAFERR